MRKHSKEYDDYMKSDEWAEKCNQRLEIAGHKCEMCGRLEKIQRVCKYIIYLTKILEEKMSEMN